MGRRGRASPRRAGGKSIAGRPRCEGSSPPAPCQGEPGLTAGPSWGLLQHHWGWRKAGAGGEGKKREKREKRERNPQAGSWRGELGSAVQGKSSQRTKRGRRREGVGREAVNCRRRASRSEPRRKGSRRKASLERKPGSGKKRLAINK